MNLSIIAGLGMMVESRNFKAWPAPRFSRQSIGNQYIYIYIYITYYIYIYIHISINNDININMNIDINLNIDITPPHQPHAGAVRRRGRGGVMGWGVISILILISIWILIFISLWIWISSIVLISIPYWYPTDLGPKTTSGGLGCIQCQRMGPYQRGHSGWRGGRRAWAACGARREGKAMSLPKVMTGLSYIGIVGTV